MQNPLVGCQWHPKLKRNNALEKRIEIERYGFLLFTPAVYRRLVDLAGVTGAWAAVGFANSAFVSDAKGAVPCEFGLVRLGVFGLSDCSRTLVGVLH